MTTGPEKSRRPSRAQRRDLDQRDADDAAAAFHASRSAHGLKVALASALRPGVAEGTERSTKP